MIINFKAKATKTIKDYITEDKVYKVETIIANRYLINSEKGLLLFHKDNFEEVGITEDKDA